MHRFFKSDFYDFEFLRILSAAPFGGAEIAECLEAAGHIKDLDPISWHDAWSVQAKKAEGLAKQAEKSGDRVSARRAYMRCSNYHRASGYMFNDRDEAPDPRCLSTALKVRDTFSRGARLLDGEVFFLDIPYENTTLPAYLYLPPDSKRLPGKIPVLISSGGADALQEEVYYVYAATGPELGYAVLTYEGPGQGIVLRKDKLRMRPDWEVVIDHVINHLSTFSTEHSELELDMERLTIAGASMGGYYSLRGASDPRIKACVAIDPFYDMYDFATKHIGAVISVWKSGWVASGMVNSAIELASRTNFQMKWEVSLAKWFFGVSTPIDTLLQMKKYTLKLADGTTFLTKVKCPVLVSGAAQSLYLEPGTDAKLVYDGLQHLEEGQKVMWISKAPEEGGLQAKIGAINLCAQRTFEFLDHQLEIVRPALFEEESGS